MTYQHHNWPLLVNTLIEAIRTARDDDRALTIDELAAELALEVGYPITANFAHQVKRRAIRQLRSTDENIVPVWLDRWHCVYVLTNDEALTRPWYTSRSKYVDTSLATMAAVSRSMMRATSPRSIDGRAARLINRTVRQLRENIDALNDDREALDEERRATAGTP